MIIAQIIVYSAGFYLLLGVVFAVYFVTFQAAKMDEAAKGTGIGFKILIFFGAMPLWSVLLYRVVRGSKVPVEKNSHRLAAGGSDD